MAPVDAGPAAGAVDVGAPSDFASDGIYDTWAYAHSFFVVRRGGVLFAVSGICTHDKKGRLARDTNGASLVCPWHGGRFSADGAVMKGPPQTRLALLGIRLEGGRVRVNPGRSFPGGDLASEGASIRI